VGKHEKTLVAIFAEPVRGNIRWADREALLKHHGATITEGSGSRVRVNLKGVVAVFHRPHPRPQSGKGTVKAVRRLFMEASITP
jgi:hypothetical protein